VVTVAASALEVAAAVRDPELPVLTLAELGVLRDVEVSGERVVVTITPTYSGCPALTEMRTDLVRALHAAGYADVEIRTELAPAWSSDDITPAGRDKLAAAGIAPPGPVTTTPLLTLAPPPAVSCPRCGAHATRETSHFGPTPCTALWRCTACGEPFERVKEH
jgi:ring-1,2-phenylacetyl-CoA epoxidase subunit PaaD